MFDWLNWLYYALFPWRRPLAPPGRLIFSTHPESTAVDRIFAHFQPPKAADTTAVLHFTLDGGQEQTVATFTPSDLPNAPQGTVMGEIDASDASKGEAWLSFANRFKTLVSPHQAFDVASLFPSPETPGMLSFSFGGQTPDAPAVPPVVPATV